MTTWNWPALAKETGLAELIRVLNHRLAQLALAFGAVLAGTGVINRFVNGDTTPSVAGARIWTVDNTGATNVTALRGGAPGQEVLLWATTANTTLVHSAALALKGGVNVTMTATETRRFVTVDGTNWREA